MDGRNGLLTGDIGSGKSTLVDAITTLLVPAHRVQYNRAAGADKRERSLRSYVLGYFKNERGDLGGTSKPVPLRDHNSFSVILAVFSNRGFEEQVTLAQVFWMKEAGGQPDRFYAVARKELSIARHFSNFGSQLKDLRRQLRADGVELFPTFPQYSACFRRYLGIPSEQSLELFHQTVSLKTVGNLTDFVREHMLEQFEVDPLIENLIAHYENLNQAHAAVLKAKAQVEALTPLVSDCDQLEQQLVELVLFHSRREALSIFFSHLKAQLVRVEIKRLELKEEKLQARIEELKQDRSKLQAERGEIQTAISQNGGDRLESLAAQIAALTETRLRRSTRYEQYAALLKAVDGIVPQTPEQFIEQQHEFKALRSKLNSEEAEIDNRRVELKVRHHQLKQAHLELDNELEGLKSRRSNISGKQVAIRQALCRALGLSEETLPFVGELLQVREEERDWEGAVERILHNFALSLLVPETLYQKVSDWVDQTRLQGRLVYYRVQKESSSGTVRLPENSLPDKLEIKQDSLFYGWLDRQLRQRFDFVCCRDLSGFRREKKAVTLRGQVKAGGGRHEKDDRHDLHDRSRYVLGWSNEAKIAVLTQKKEKLEDELYELITRLHDLQLSTKDLREKLTALNTLSGFQEFQDMDWKPLVQEIADLEEERKLLQESSDILARLSEQLKFTEDELISVQEKLDQINGELGGVKSDKENHQIELLELEDEVPSKEQRELFPALDEFRQECLPGKTLTIRNCQSSEREVREKLRTLIETMEKRATRLRLRIVSAMGEFRNTYPLETQEIDDSIEAASEYRKLLEQLELDDLPRFETRFKELLNENAIREIASFHSKLHQEREVIKEKVDIINTSLQDIDYNPGRYIFLELQKTADPEIRDFQVALTACTEGALTGSDDIEYSEQKFLRVKAIVERLKGREGTQDLDRRWRRKVTDVRRWFEFSASERRRSDDTEYEHYADSGGKSGGQKEKLAYTILAASLSYQYGLERNVERARKFHFVVIDEAFGRSSDDSATFGLELFKTLDLQLLIVTPLQKIHIIEPYVSSVGFVANPDQRESLLQNLTIEEYREQKALRGR